MIKIKTKLSFLMFIFCLLSGQFLKAQSSPDSLQAIWNNVEYDPSARLKAYHELIKEHTVFNDPLKGLEMTEKGLELAIEMKDSHWIADYYNLKAISFLVRGDFNKGRELNDLALEISEEIQDSIMIGKCLGDLAAIYTYFGDFLKAYHLYQKALKICTATGYDYGVLMVTGNIGNMYNMMGDWKQAEAYYLKQLEINKELNDIQTKVTTGGNLGIAYFNSGDTTQALEYFESTSVLAKEEGYGMNEAINHMYRWHICIGRGEFDKANESFLRIVELKDILNSSLLEGQLKCMECTLESKRKNFTKAVDVCELALEMIKYDGRAETEIIVLKELYKINKSLNNGDAALAYYEQFQAIQDSIDDVESKARIQRMDFKKQIREDSLAQLEKERVLEENHAAEVQRKNNQRNVLLGSGIILLLLTGGFYSRWKYVRKSRDIISKEKARSENLLLNILPSEIAEELKEKGKADARNFNMVSILFTDFKEFTQAAENMSAQDLVSEINVCFEAFDHICDKYGIEKIKTIGDAYMAAGGLPIPSSESVKNTVLAALEMQAFIVDRKTKRQRAGLPAFEMRAGIHTGAVVAGIVGVRKFQYDLWGDTVNTASRVESHGVVDKVNISEETYNLVKADPIFRFESRGKINVKGKGELEMYFVE